MVEGSDCGFLPLADIVRSRDGITPALTVRVVHLVAGMDGGPHRSDDAGRVRDLRIQNVLEAMVAGVSLPEEALTHLHDADLR